MPDHFFVYPAYLARKTSRALGRRVPEAIAPTDVTLERIAAAAKKLGYAASVEAEKAYPRQPLGLAGRVRIAKKGGVKKAAFLRQLADELRAGAPTSGKS